MSPSTPVVPDPDTSQLRAGQPASPPHPVPPHPVPPHPVTTQSASPNPVPPRPAPHHPVPPQPIPPQPGQWVLPGRPDQVGHARRLWLYQLWYHVPPFNTSLSANVDIWAVLLTGICTLLLLLVPFIPGLRDIPRLIPLHRLIWRSWYRSAEGSVTSQPRPAGHVTGHPQQ